MRNMRPILRMNFTSTIENSSVDLLCSCLCPVDFTSKRMQILAIKNF